MLSDTFVGGGGGELSAVNKEKFLPIVFHYLMVLSVVPLKLVL